MSTAFERFCLMESVAIPMAMVLSAMMMIGSWGITEIGEDDREISSMFLGAGEHSDVFGFGGASHNARDDGRY
jgi:hypothetical protein